MLILPAIDLSEGQCVRLVRGQREAKTVYSADPVALAQRWEREGAQFLHVVDLDGAFAGEPRNLEVVAAIARAVDIPLELGGGLRTVEALEWAFACGVQRAILGTSAVADRAFLKQALARFGERLVVGIDAREGKVAVRGWGEVTAWEALDLAREMEALGVPRLIFTDIATDGTLSGPNLPALEQLVRAVDLPVIASGGVSCVADVLRLQTLEPLGLEGVIIGKALYEGTIRLAELWAALSETGPRP